MKVTYNWLKDFVDISLEPQALADKLTMAGLEVKSCERKLDDYVFEIEITSNRPDWLSVIGIAREISALTGKKLKQPALPKPCALAADIKSVRQETAGVPDVSISIADKKDCPLYSLRILAGVTVGPSPRWLSERLEAVGCRSINSIVDITNYILFERGQPLHAFDLDKLCALKKDVSSPLCIGVRRAKDKEEMAAIDGVKRQLRDSTLVITAGRSHNESVPVAVAGVIGGKDTEVDESTRNILLEAAVFDPVVIRRSRQELGVQTESSYRFERSVDTESVREHSRMASALVRSLCPAREVLEKASAVVKPAKRTITCEYAFIDRLLGMSVPASRIVSILQCLGCMVTGQTKEKFVVQAPSFRPDLAAPVDLVEEVARIYGYEHVPTTIAPVVPSIQEEDSRGVRDVIKKALVALGLNEAVTVSLTERAQLAGFSCALSGSDAEIIEIANPLSGEQEVLRTSLIPGLCASVSRNINQKQEYVALFEIAKTYYRRQKAVEEPWTLAFALSGTQSYWRSQGMVKEPVTLLHVKGVIEAVLEQIGIVDVAWQGGAHDEMTVLSRKEPVGACGRIRKEHLDRFGIKNRDVFFAEISLEPLFRQATFKKRFASLPVYPGILRDISVVVKESVSAAMISDLVKEKAGALLKAITVIDYYRGKQIPDGCKSLTFSCLYRSDERTLTEADITPIHTVVVQSLASSFQAQLR